MTNKQKAIVPEDTGSDRSSKINISSHSSYSPKFLHSGKGKPCPICDRIKDGDCRWNDEVVLCHTHKDRDAEIFGYVYRGVKEIWGQYFPVVEPVPKPVRAKSKREFIYQDVDGNALVQITRTDNGKGQKFFSQSRRNGHRWVKRLTPEVKAKLRLYRIDDPLNQAAIAAQKILLIVEGEGKVDLLLKMGIAATSSIGGAGKWRSYGYPNYREDLKGAKVVLCPDQDELGVKHCLNIEQDFPGAQWLYASPNSPLWDNLPRNKGLDIADWIANGAGLEQIMGAIGPKRSQVLPQGSDAANEQPEKKTIAQLLLELAEAYHYFHTPDQQAYVDVEVKGVRQTFPVQHETFEQRLSRELYCQHGKTVGSETLNQVLRVLEGRACLDGEEREVDLRLAEQGGTVYIDLGTADWTAIAVSAKGWEIVSNPPVRFWRPGTMLPLPTPKQGGTLEELRSLLNVDEDGWVLVVCWLLFCFYPRYSHPILVLFGEAGVGKTFAALLLKLLIDPGRAPLIPKVADLHNLAIAAENRWVLAYDNLSYLTVDQSDALCRISTGGGFSTRALYKNKEETVFEFIRPQILTGIDSLASRGDLLERSLLVELHTIAEPQRFTEEELMAKLKRERGHILGALLTALSKTLEALPTVEVERLPRMADFTKFAIAAESALGLPAGSFLKVYAGNRQEAHAAVLESSPVAMTLQRFMASRPSWQGTASELLEELDRLIDDKTRRGKDWAGNPRSLGKILKRLAPDLRATGLTITAHRTNSRRSYTIDWGEKGTSPLSPPSQAGQREVLGGDSGPWSDVTGEDVNVIGDVGSKTDLRNLSPTEGQDVTAPKTSGWGLQPVDDNSDNSDVDNDPESKWVNKLVRKHGKSGWFGPVVRVRDDMAEVLWHGDQQPSLVPLAELEEVG